MHEICLRCFRIIVQLALLIIVKSAWWVMSWKMKWSLRLDNVVVAFLKSPTFIHLLIIVLYILLCSPPVFIMLVGLFACVFCFITFVHIFCLWQALSRSFKLLYWFLKINIYSIFRLSLLFSITDRGLTSTAFTS